MSDVTDWIQEAQEELGVPFRRCSDDVAKDLVKRARAAFVVGNPRVWWLSLKRKFVAYDSENRSIADVLPTPIPTAYFIAEDDSADLPVYELRPHEVELLRENCPPFEYYYVESDLQWMVIESDHDQFIVTKLDDEERIQPRK